MSKGRKKHIIILTIAIICIISSILAKIFRNEITEYIASVSADKYLASTYSGPEYVNISSTTSKSTDSMEEVVKIYLRSNWSTASIDKSNIGWCLKKGAGLYGLGYSYTGSGEIKDSRIQSKSNAYSGSNAKSGNQNKMNWLFDNMVRFGSGVPNEEKKVYRQNLAQITGIKELTDSSKYSDDTIFKAQQYVLWAYSDNDSTVAEPSNTLYTKLKEKADEQGKYTGDGTIQEGNNKIKITKETGYTVTSDGWIGPLKIVGNNKKSKITLSNDKGYKCATYKTKNTGESNIVNLNTYNGTFYIKLNQSLLDNTKYTINFTFKNSAYTTKAWYYTTNHTTYDSDGNIYNPQPFLMLERTLSSENVSFTAEYENVISGKYNLNIVKKPKGSTRGVYVDDALGGATFYIKGQVEAGEIVKDPIATNVGDFCNVFGNINMQDVNTADSFLIQEIKAPTGYYSNDKAYWIFVYKKKENEKIVIDYIKVGATDINEQGLPANPSADSLTEIKPGVSLQDVKADENINILCGTNNISVYIENPKLEGTYNLGIVKKPEGSTTGTLVTDAKGGAEFEINQYLNQIAPYYLENNTKISTIEKGECKVYDKDIDITDTLLPDIYEIEELKAPDGYYIGKNQKLRLYVVKEIQGDQTKKLVLKSIEAWIYENDECIGGPYTIPRGTNFNRIGDSQFGILLGTEDIIVYIENPEETEEGEYDVQLKKEGTDGIQLGGVTFSVETTINGIEKTLDPIVTDANTPKQIGEKVTIDKKYIGTPDTYTLTEMDLGNNTGYIKLEKPIVLTVTKDQSISSDGSKINNFVNGISLSIDGETETRIGDTKAEIKMLINEKEVKITAELVGTTINVTVQNPEDNPDKTSIKVKKVWEDNNNQDKKRPASIDVKLIDANGNKIDVENNPVTLNEENNWEYTWNELEENIEYKVEENVTIDGYSVYYSKTEENGVITFTVTNAYTPPDKTQKTAEKEWRNVKNANLYKVEFILKKNNQLTETKKEVIGSGTARFVGLEKLDANGNEITYEVEEGKAYYRINETSTDWIELEEGKDYVADEENGVFINTVPNINTLFSLNIIKQVKGLSIPLSGAGFKVSIKDESGKELANTSKVYTTGANGKLTEPITGLTIDAEGKTYTVTITETQVPEGYEGIEGPITFNVKSVKSGNKFVLEQGEKTVTNSKKVTVGENEILVEAENAPEGPHKGVKEVTNQDSGYNGDEVHDWVITTKIPKDIAKYGKYVITDVIDERLVFSGLESVKVSIDGKNLTKDKDYKTEYNEGTRTLKIAFIEENFKGANLPEGKTIEIRFNTTFKLDENGNIIALNQTVPNQAELTYGNSEGAEVSLKTEIPEIHTGGVSIYKYDEETGVALEGATFKIATSKENAQNGVFVKDIKGNDITAKSNEKGIATFSGLEFGEDALNKAEYVTTDEITGATVYRYDWTKVSTNYYIVETEAPEGFNKSEDIYEVVIRKDSNEVVEIKDLISVANNKKIYDLSLRKFITKIDDKEVTDRIPDVDITPLVDGTSTTATYNHPKDPVLVAQNQLVTYTIRVYNEGPTDAYASLVKDDIPQGLEFVTYTEGDGSTNDTYKWKLVDENDNEVTEPSKAKYVVTDYLAKDAEEKNLLKGFNPETMTELDYRDVQVQFKVIEPNTSDRVIINYAQIADDSDKGGNSITDRDSTPNEWKGEDDEDIEKIKVLYFDLALRKWVTQAIVTENGQTQVTETGHKAEDDPEEVVKVDLKKSKLSNVIVKFRYSIRITNEGEIAGEAQEISDYIPQGLVFIPEDNPDWRQEEGKVVTEKLKGKTLQPGESAEVEILLTWVNSENNMGVMVNTAEISKDYNEYGSPDIDSTPNNKVPGEDDIDDAPVMLTIKTGSEIIMIVTLGLGVIAIIGAGIEIIRKKVIRN